MIHKLVQKASRKYRGQRDALFRKLFERQIAQGCTILDIGGEAAYWEKSLASADLYRNCTITMINRKISASRFPNIHFRVGDATDLSEFADRSFDIVFSNSVIEHVGSWENQQKMAREVRRLGKQYFLQTPNYYFVIEPHSYFPFFNRLPLPLRCVAARFWPWGNKRIPDFSPKSREYIRTSVRLLKRREMKELFPDAELLEERALGGVKSFIVHNVR